MRHLISFRQRRPDRSRGQALVEFALVAPMFFVLLLVLIEGGRFIFFYETLHSATRDGARFAIVNGNNSLICPVGPPPTGSWSCDPTGERVKQRVANAAFNVLGPLVPCGSAGLCVPAGYPRWFEPTTNERGSKVTVKVQYRYNTIIPLLPLPPLTIEAESTLVVNN
jgi:hypothetical protein